MKVALICEKMAMCNESVYAALTHVPGVECDLYHYDNGIEAQFHYDGEVDHNIMRYLQQNKVDVAIYEGPDSGKCRPKIETFNWMRQKAKTICLVNDGGCHGWWPALQEYKDANCFDLVVNQDGCPEWPGHESGYTCHPLLEASYFNPKPLSERTTFFGGVHGGEFSQPRDKYTHFIRSQCGFVMGHRSDKWGDYKPYADFLCNTKVTINFCESGGGSPMLKFRPIEAGFAGCVLLEKKNPITPLYLTPSKDYLEWEVIEDVKGILDSLTESRMEELSQSIRETCTKKLNPYLVWTDILNRLNLPVGVT